MELDPRIIEGKKPLDCFDVDIAKQFIGKKGYFSDCLNVYTHIRNMEEDVLQSLDENNDEAYVGTCRNKWEFFLPAEWVKPEEPEKKYRPFSLEEFIGDMNLGLGPWIRMRPVRSKKECKFLYTGYLETEASDYICLGCFQFDFVSLFQNYEICINGEWQPFGIEEQV